MTCLINSWTQWLAPRVKHVVAIDPAALKLDPLPSNVTHLAQRLETTIEVLKTFPKFSLVVCDVNFPAEEAIDKLRLLLTECVAPGGWLLLTAKITGNPRRWKASLEKTVRHFVKVLPDFSEPKMKFLLSNKNERTYCAFKLTEEEMK